MKKNVCPRDGGVRGRSAAGMKIYKQGDIAKGMGMTEWDAFAWPWYPLERLSEHQCPILHSLLGEKRSYVMGECKCDEKLKERCCDCDDRGFWKNKKCCAFHEYCCRGRPGDALSWKCCPIHPSKLVYI